MLVCKCDSVDRLIDELHGIDIEKMSGTWVFRGQADSRWKLESTLFRLARNRRGQSAASEIEDEFKRLHDSTQHSLERYLAKHSEVPNRYVKDADYRLALAQHHGAPTRALDFTKDYRVACYFAASEALRNPHDGEAMSVYALANLYTTIGHATGSSRMFEPSSAANPNVEAQRGVLVEQDWKLLDFWNPDMAQEVSSAKGSIDADMDTRLIRLDLPTRLAFDLYVFVSDRGIDGASMFPGPKGMALYAYEQAAARTTTRAR